MITECRHCEADVTVGSEQGAGIVRCTDCSRLNVLLGASSDGVVRFGEFEIIQEVGQGANAVVCKAAKVDTGDIVAVKLFYSESGVDTLSTREFIREHEFCTEVIHENIVRTYRGGEVDGVLFLELEYIDGMNLAEYLETYGPMEPAEAFSVGAFTASALDHVWSNYLVIHRDIKPQNIMIDNTGNVKVCDFGMVTAHERAAVDINAVEGTPYYLSPECVTDGEYQDNRSDIYSLGATVFHVIAGEPPFNYDSLEEVVYARIREEAPDIRDIDSSVPESAAKVLQTMMQKDRELRYVTAYECLEDLQRVRNGKDPVLVDPNRSRVNEGPSAAP
jgi:serine/threonine protein kinase